MKDLSRRNFLGLAAMAPSGALLPGAAVGAARTFAAATQASARARIQEQHLPNVPLVTQDGKRVRFYDDLVKGRIVTINFFYAKCEDVCPLVTANLVQVQKLLGDQVGRQVFMYSCTLKPFFDRQARGHRNAPEGPWLHLSGAGHRPGQDPAYRERSLWQ